MCESKGVFAAENVIEVSDRDVSSPGTRLAESHRNCKPTTG
jgi:hypothetical protein